MFKLQHATYHSSIVAVDILFRVVVKVQLYTHYVKLALRNEGNAQSKCGSHRHPDAAVAVHRKGGGARSHRVTRGDREEREGLREVGEGQNIQAQGCHGISWDVIAMDDGGKDMDEREHTPKTRASASASAESSEGQFAI